MKKLTLNILFASMLVASADAAIISYNLDFGNNTTDLAVDMNGNSFLALAPTGFHVINNESWAIGNGLTLSFTGVDNYAFPSTANPLVADGIFVPESSTGPLPFSLSGLTPGATVTLFAIGSWDQAGRAVLVSFGGSSFVDTGIAPNNGWNPPPGTGIPGPQVLTSEMALVASNVLVDNTGIINGALDRGVGRPEGQLGGFIIEVNTPVPEPASAGLLLGGGVLLGMLRRRRRS